MKNKEYCFNCKSEINQGNWKMGNFRCKKCFGIEEIDVNKVVKEVVKILERR